MLRKPLPHNVPPWIDPSKAVYFITISCRYRNENQLATPEVAPTIIETVRHRQNQGLWWPHIFLLMPDHLHLLVTFPASAKPIRIIVSKWKEWIAKTCAVQWQDDFFEHRLRGEESRREKAAYILQNPVRKALVSRIEDWPYVYFASGQMPNFPC